MVWNVHLHGGMSNNTRVLFPHCCNFFNSLSPLHFLPPPFFPLLLLLLILLLLMGVSLLLLWADLDLFLLVSSFTGLPPANHRLKLIIQVHIPNCPKIWNNEFDLKGSLLHLIKSYRTVFSPQHYIPFFKNQYYPRAILQYCPWSILVSHLH